MFVTLALSDIDFIDLERPTPNNSKSSLCAQRRILKLYKYCSPTCRTQISSFVIIGLFAVSVGHCLAVERPPKDGHTNPTRHYIFQQLPGNDSWPFGARLLTWSAIHSTFKRVHGSVRLRRIKNDNNCIQKNSFITICMWYVLILSLF